MKCFGKRHPYPSEVERIQKETETNEFNDLVNQTKINEESLKALEEKIKSIEEESLVVTDKLDEIQQQQQQYITQEVYFTPVIEFVSGEICRSKHWSGNVVRATFKNNLTSILTKSWLIQN